MHARGRGTAATWLHPACCGAPWYSASFARAPTVRVEDRPAGFWGARRSRVAQGWELHCQSTGVVGGHSHLSAARDWEVERQSSRAMVIPLVLCSK